MGDPFDLPVQRPEKPTSTSTEPDGLPPAGGSELVPHLGENHEPPSPRGHDDAPPPDYGYEAPPPDYGYEAPPPDDGYPSHGYGRTPRPAPERGGDEAEQDPQVSVNGVLLRVLAALHGHAVRDADSLCQEIRNSEEIMEALSAHEREAWTGVLEVIELTSANVDDGTLDFAQMPHMAAYPNRVRALVRQLREHVESGQASKNPHLELNALVEALVRQATRRAALELVEALDERRNVDDLVNLHSAVPLPTKRTTVSSSGVKISVLARDLEAQVLAQKSSSPLRRYSSGYLTLDLAGTVKGEESLGFFVEGTLNGIAAGAGEGKSSFAAHVVPSIARDMLNMGRGNAKVLLAHTEESAVTKFKEMNLGRGERNHDVVGNVVIASVMSDRRGFVEAIYQEVANAIRLADTLGCSPAECTVDAVVLDYFQQLKDTKESEYEATSRTADLLLNGVTNFNPDEMEKYSGVNFQKTTGMRWPDELRAHRPTVLAFAQLIKFDQKELFWNPKSRGQAIEKFVVTQDNGDPWWDVLPGDRRIPDKSEIRGAGTFTQHCHSIQMLSRSRVEGNSVKTGPDGLKHLTDTRARLIFGKMRIAPTVPFVDMKFDSQRSGRKGQYFDFHADDMIAAGKAQVAPGYTYAGDPHLPLRGSKHPFDGVSWINR